MSITSHLTPNPNARKYVLPEKRFAAPRNFATAAAADADPLAVRLMALEGVYNVFYTQDFVTINKRPEAPWEPLETQVLDILTAYFRPSN